MASNRAGNEERTARIAASPFGRLPEGWRCLHLRDIATKIGSGATPKGGESSYIAKRERFALIRSQNVFDRRFDSTGLAFITDTQAHELRGAVTEAGDVLLNITGDGITFGRACMVPEDVRPACVNQHVCIVRTDREICDPGYLLAYLTHPTIKNYIESFNAGGSRRAITKGHIESFEIPLPPLPEQRRIAGILGALDDKIELNRRQNETLEAMARAIFKSWFVDFDPVHAKAAGRRPEGMDPATAALFPDTFQDSPLGPGPEGWRVLPLGELVTLEREQVSPAQQPTQVFDHHSIPAYDDGRWPVRETGEAIKSSKFVVPQGAILISKLNPRIPRVWLVSPMANTPSICSTEFLVAQPRAVSDRGFCFEFLRSEAFTMAFAGRVTGTSGSHQRVKPADLLNMPVTLPAEKIRARFMDQVGPLYRRHQLLSAEGRELAALRDALLPRLLSGELPKVTLAGATP